MSFEAYFAAHLPTARSFHPHYDEALRWILEAGGKHFRAQLLLGSLKALISDFMGAEAAQIAAKRAYPVAAAVEAFHAYSLIHDDLPCMDGSDLRRGRQTLHLKYDETTAVLVGDALNTHAFLMIAESELSEKTRIECVRILAAAGGVEGMVLGQALDCYFENTILNREQLEFLHSKKTGALIAAAMQMGAVIAAEFAPQNAAAQPNTAPQNASDASPTLQNIHKIGQMLGLAFQIHDDIIDATATLAAAGKPVHHDGAKNSFVNLLGLDAAKMERERLLEAMLARTPTLLKPMINNLITKYLKD